MRKNLDETVNASGRAEKVKEIKGMIEKQGVKYVYYQHISVTGRIVGKGFPAQHFETVCQSGYQLVYGSVSNLFMDRYGNYIGFGAHESELVGIPEVETFKILPWEPRIARVYCDCFDTETGRPFDADCRGNLKDIVSDFEKELGYTFLVGVEPEMMWLKEDEKGGLTGTTKPYCYHIAQFEQLRPVFLDVISYAQAMGLDMVQGDHEDAPGQLELNFRHDTAVKTADNLTTYRHVANEVARKHGIIACFMPKPFVGMSANGHHHHFSMVDKNGKNVLYEEEGPAKLSQFALHFAGGVLAHADAICAITASTVNSYKRFWDRGYWAPLYKDYGWQNRTSLLRIASRGRMEYRAVDAAVNPYLSIGALLIAGLDGVRRRIDPGDPQSENVYDIYGKEKHLGETQTRLKQIPMSLGQALEALKEDKVVQTALPGRMLRVFMHYKSDEWERYLAHVSDWELQQYLRVLP